MKLKFPRTFQLLNQTEPFEVVRKNVEQDVVFHGTNLWILFFAILIASLGLNINSAAVVIGAMLISPLMGPILGIGIGVATNNLRLIKKALKNFGFAAIVGLIASTIYFWLTPLDKAHSEILARISPTIYDVLIALFGGFAGSIAIVSKHKGNVIPGVAIATALMPPLCTAGYGLATWQLNYFFGAMYLYLINSVFIGAATLITASLLKFPSKEYDDPKLKRRETGIIIGIIVLTLIPSIYMGYDIINQNEFTERAESFIKEEAFFPNDYLLKKEIRPKRKEIILTFGGAEITPEQIAVLEAKMKYYELDEAKLEVKQGFAFLEEESTDPKIGLAMKENETERNLLQSRLDSIFNQEKLSRQIFKELKAIDTTLAEAIIQPVSINIDTIDQPIKGYLVLLSLKEEMPAEEKTRLTSFLQVRLDNKNVRLVVEKKE